MRHDIGQLDAAGEFLQGERRAGVGGGLEVLAPGAAVLLRLVEVELVGGEG
jgi:hypothetical protein